MTWRKSGFQQLPMASGQPTTTWTKIIACIILHILLILVHIALLVVYSRHYEYSITADIGSPFGTRFALLVTAISQTIGTIYLAILVLLTQQLALRRNLHTRQTLTAIHDQSNAWLGLGSSVWSLWAQFRLPAALWNVLYIVLYLTGIFALHISIPSLFHVEAFNNTMPVTYPASLAYTDPFNHTLSSYDLLTVYGQLPTTGLVDNVVYDVIPQVPNASGNTTANATVFDVQCHAVPEAQFVFSEVTRMASDGAWQWQFLYRLFPNDTVSQVFTPLPRPNSISVSCSGALSPNNNGGPCANVITATVPIIDSSGKANPYLVSVLPAVVQSPSEYVTSVQLLACNTYTRNVSVTISVETRSPIAGLPTGSSDALWSDWNLSDYQGVTDAAAVEASCANYYAPASGYSRMPETINPNGTNNRDPTDHSSYTDYAQFTVYDAFLMKDLGFSASGVGFLTPDSATNVTLADLNFSMGKAAAAVYWYTRTYNRSSKYTDHDDDSGEQLLDVNRPLRGEAIINTVLTRSRLNLSLAPIIVGLAAAALLLGLAFVLIRQPASDPSASSTTIDSAGILQLTWLLGNEPRLATVSVPEVDELRVAGMFDIQMSDRAQEKEERAIGISHASLRSSYMPVSTTMSEDYAYDRDTKS